MPNSFHSHRPYSSGLTVVDASSPVFSRPSPRLPTVRLAVKVFSSCGYLSRYYIPPDNVVTSSACTPALTLRVILSSSWPLLPSSLTDEGRCFMCSILRLYNFVLFYFFFRRRGKVRLGISWGIFEKELVCFLIKSEREFGNRKQWFLKFLEIFGRKL